MTMADVHVAVREALRGSKYSKFVVVVEALELHPGRVDVEWRITVFAPDDEDPRETPHRLRGRNPYELIAMLRDRLSDERKAQLDTEPPPPPALADVGAPPPPEGNQP